MTKASLGGGKSARTLPTAAKGGAKRSPHADSHSLPLATVIAGAHRHDSVLFEETLACIVIEQLAASCSGSALCLTPFNRVRQTEWHGAAGSRTSAGAQTSGPKVRERGAGWLNGHIAGSTGISAC